MLYIERWKANLIVVICVLGLLYALPNVLGAETVAWMQKHLPSFMPTQTVNLGLDLRGGSHLLLEVDVKEVIGEQMQGLLEQTRTDLRKEKVGYTDLALRDEGLTFKLTDTANSDKAREVLLQSDPKLSIAETNGVFTVKMKEEQILARESAAMEQSIEIVRRRIDETGTREPSIQKQGDARILVQLPGLDDPGRIKKLLGQTAKLSFRLVDESASADPQGRLPVGTERLPSAEEAGRSWVVQKRVMVSGDTLEDAQLSFDNGGAPCVSFRFAAQGARRFGDATAANVGRLFAIVLDGKVISAPVIREPIFGGSGIISGHFTTESAHDLALLLRAGALPAPIKVIEERTIGPGLGADSIKAGTYACIVGMVLVMISVVVCYGLFGIFANIALLINMALIFAALSFLQATLTLPGIAGIVLTIGMAVDANVLIFERMREESRLGRAVIPALDAGYKRALSSIMDANITTLIAAFLLFTFGSGTIKGFAVTLSIGIITSIFSAVMVSHLIIVWWTQIKKPKELPI
ncbi:MAG: protein translocase subunit SecD [Alphaproteobacteria bacterium]|nr:protein translocase subunit SecD [Alphaproteobacteria bacterium]